MKLAEPLQLAQEDLYRLYVAGLLANDRAQCQKIFEEWLAVAPDLSLLYENLVCRSLYEVGERWEQGHISVATEHLATAISESLLNLTYSRLFATPRNGRVAVVACVANEYHQIGGKMVADIFELHGWRGYFLGANTPLADLKTLLAEKRPDVLALSLALPANLDRLTHAATEVHAAFPALPIVVGGQAFRWLERAQVEHLPGVHCLKNLGELETWIQKETAPKNV